MYGVGGVTGALVGGYTTEYGHNELVFYGLAFIGFCIACTGCLMSRALEASAANIINMTLCERVKVNFIEIKKGFKIREYHRAVFYFILLGALVPSFLDYFYYYSTEIAGITKFQYAMVSLVSYICMFIGTVCYNACLKTNEIRSMMVLACIINLFGAVSSLLFV